MNTPRITLLAAAIAASFAAFSASAGDAASAVLGSDGIPAPASRPAAAVVTPATAVAPAAAHVAQDRVARKEAQTLTMTPATTAAKPAAGIADAKDKDVAAANVAKPAVNPYRGTSAEVETLAEELAKTKMQAQLAEEQVKIVKANREIADMKKGGAASGSSVPGANSAAISALERINKGGGAGDSALVKSAKKGKKGKTLTVPEVAVAPAPFVPPSPLLTGIVRRGEDRYAVVSGAGLVKAGSTANGVSIGEVGDNFAVVDGKKLYVTSAGDVATIANADKQTTSPASVLGGGKTSGLPQFPDFSQAKGVAGAQALGSGGAVSPVPKMF